MPSVTVRKVSSLSVPSRSSIGLRLIDLLLDES